MPLLADLMARPGVAAVPIHRPRRPRYRGQWLLSLLALRPALRRAGVRLYHATEPNGLVHLPGVTTVATLYDLIPLHDPAAHFPPRRVEQRYAYARYLRLLQRADRLIAISEASKADAVARLGIAPERIAVTPLAVDERRFYPRSAGRDRDGRGALRPAPALLPARRGVGATQEHRRRCCGPSHGSGARRAPSTPCISWGKWTARALAAVQAAYPALWPRRLRVLGFVPDDDLPALYGGATALVYPSLVEGFGLPVLEAMRCATPVLTSTTSSLPEAGGDAALYVDPHEPASGRGAAAAGRAGRAARGYGGAWPARGPRCLVGSGRPRRRCAYTRSCCEDRHRRQLGAGRAERDGNVYGWAGRGAGPRRAAA